MPVACTKHSWHDPTHMVPDWEQKFSVQWPLLPLCFTALGAVVAHLFLGSVQGQGCQLALQRSWICAA